LRMPANRAAEFPQTINVGCYADAGKPPADGVCQNIRLIKLIRLDKNYQPVVRKISVSPQTVKAGETAAFSSF
jgi:hypothetical protein